MCQILLSNPLGEGSGRVAVSGVQGGESADEDFLAADDVEAGGEAGGGVGTGYAVPDEGAGEGVDVDEGVFAGGQAGGDVADARLSFAVDAPRTQALDLCGSAGGEGFEAVGTVARGEDANRRCVFVVDEDVDDGAVDI